MTPVLLIVDDSASDAEILSLAIVSTGVAVEIEHVESADAGLEAIQHMAAETTPLKLVVCDHYGITRGEPVPSIIALSQAAEQLGAALVVISTAMAPQVRVALNSGGVKDILEKPLDLEGYTVLARSLHRYL